MLEALLKNNLRVSCPKGPPPIAVHMSNLDLASGFETGGALVQPSPGRTALVQTSTPKLPTPNTLPTPLVR